MIETLARAVRSPVWRRRARQIGFTLLELMIALCVLGLLMAIALPAYTRVIDNLKVDKTRQDLLVIAGKIQSYRNSHDFKLPMSLDDLTNIPTLDPWKNPYRYLNFSAPIPGIKGKIRKDHNLHPINTEFDLYSAGPDGDSVAPLTSAKSRDDIVYARDGGFVGKAEDF